MLTGGDDEAEKETKTAQSEIKVKSDVTLSAVETSEKDKEVLANNIKVNE
jgi:hypothetical protein